MLSMTVDFYIRLFIRIKEGALPCHDSIANYSHVYSCLECESYYLQPLGVHLQETLSINDKGKWKKVKKVAKDEKEEENGNEEEKKENQYTREKFSISKV